MSFDGLRVCSNHESKRSDRYCCLALSKRYLGTWTIGGFIRVFCFSNLNRGSTADITKEISSRVPFPFNVMGPTAESSHFSIYEICYTDLENEINRCREILV
jgi:hypothetical protein